MLSLRVVDFMSCHRLYDTPVRGPADSGVAMGWAGLELGVAEFSLNLFSVNIHVHQKPSSAIFREGIRLGLVYRVRVSFR